jgi:hypothetical protein
MSVIGRRSWAFRCLLHVLSSIEWNTLRTMLCSSLPVCRISIMARGPFDHRRLQPVGFLFLTW